jgi:protocatechuate 3,4-dioxygenase alpha subunit
MTTIPPTPGLAPSQTVGPFFLDCLLRPDARRHLLVQPETVGERIRIEGRVLDGDGVGVPDAVIEIWQANSRGRYRHPADMREVALDPGFLGFGRSDTDEEGRYWFETIRPGAVPTGAGDGRMQAPHICVMIFARGLLNHLATRLYFADDPAIEADPILRRVPVERRRTLLAQPRAVEGRTHYQWDIILQGAGETVFFNP